MLLFPGFIMLNIQHFINNVFSSKVFPQMPPMLLTVFPFFIEMGKRDLLSGSTSVLSLERWARVLPCSWGR